ncbi:MAG TPA: hypothetical protein VF176_04745 [Solirubrobacterales bacterium]
MKRLKGPELKMPDLKVPPFLVDLFYDLRDRRLLPLVGLVIVAIVAVPFLLGGSDETAPPPPVAAGASTSTAPIGTPAAKLTVVEAKPGLRDYRKRLSRRHPTNPFKQRYTGAVLKGAKLNPQSTTSSSSTTTSSDTTSVTTTTTDSLPPTSTSTGDAGGGKSGSGSDVPQLTLFTFVADVKIVRSEGGGEKVKRDTTIRHRVMPMTPLPGEKAPVVTYMGIDAESKKALLMVSNNVKSVFGDGKCLSGTDTCQLLAVEPGFPETFVYGPNDVRYRVSVLKIEPVPVRHS